MDRKKERCDIPNCANVVEVTPNTPMNFPTYVPTNTPTNVLTNVPTTLKTCDAGTDMFKCADGGGCVVKPNLCNGYNDCLDGSDECMCDDIVSCNINKEQFCVPRNLYCKGKALRYETCVPDKEASCKGVKPEQGSEDPLVSNEMMKCYKQYNTAMLGHLKMVNFRDYCDQECNQAYKHFCPSIMAAGWLGTPGRVRWACKSTTIDLKQVRNTKFLHLSFFCSSCSITNRPSVARIPPTLTGL